ncbi:MAG: glycosyltransferase family 4 protein [Candidatus Dojkabacteria bacterium]|nr:MAG: glycosyltransferase family 4 protein [Candidatus Dojkabacteria bacterium]
MNILIVTRDTKHGIGTTVKNLVWQFESRADVNKVTVIAPETFEVFTDKVNFKIAPLKGQYFFTKEITFGISAAKAMKEAFSEAQYDIVHLHSNIINYGVIPRLGAKIVSTFQGTHKALMNMTVPVVSTFHNTHKASTLMANVNGLKYRIGKYLHIPFMKLDSMRVHNSKIVTCVSTYTLDEVKKERENDTEAFVFVPNGVKTDVYHKKASFDKAAFWKEKYGITDDTKKLLYIGRLESGKGLDHLVAAVAEMENTTLIFVGDGAERENLEKIPFVKCLGYVGSESDKNDLYNAADLFVFPSLYENFPLVIGEAMAAGTPMIATKVGMVPYMLQDDEDVLVEPGNSEAMHQKILALLSNKEKYTQESIENRQFAEKNLSWSVVADTYLNLYKKMTP